MSGEADRPELEAGARLTIDLAAIAANWRLLAERASPAECAAVVKADAYGTGSRQVAPALWAAGARTFFVALLSEARVVREVLPDALIYVLGGLLPGSAPAFAEIAARPVLGSLPEIRDWAAISGGAAALHVDTGMNRLGITAAEAADIAALHAAGTLGFAPSLVMSHLACADEDGHPLTARQIAVFGEVAALFPGIPASLANSAAVLDHPSARFDLCRPGIALYGGNALQGRANSTAPVVRLDARIVQLRTVAEGASVGYGAAQMMTRLSRIAIASVGYADGFLRAAGASDGHQGAEAIIAGRSCPLVGRVSMDLIAIDVTDLPEEAAQRGDFATLLDDGIGVDDLAAHAGTIGYEILTGLGLRYSRHYVG
jgi:alanine racemase